MIILGIFIVIYVAICLYDFATVAKTSWFGNIVLASIGTGAVCFLILVVGLLNKAILFLFG